MKTLVVLPMGAHPFHPGHLALYQSARQAFPDADVYVAATNDTSTRPFPFAVKEKLAKLAGVAPGRFVQVKSPFRAEEITRKYNPETDSLIFVRSEKDANSQPRPGGVKKDGSPSYLQPYNSDSKLAPFNQHAYMAYLPTVEFGPGMTSATQIRSAWPTLTDRRKTALVMSLYPRTQNNAKLAATVVKLLDAAIGATTENSEQVKEFAPGGIYKPPIIPRGPGKAPFEDDPRSQIVSDIQQLLVTGKTVFVSLPGAKGRAVQTEISNDHSWLYVQYKDWKDPKTRSRARLHVNLTADDDDSLTLSPGSKFTDNKGRPFDYTLTGTIDTSGRGLLEQDVEENQGVSEGKIQYGVLDHDNVNLIIDKSESKPDGVYSFRGILFKVKNGKVTHYAVDGKILQAMGRFTTQIGSYATNAQARSLLKSIKEGVDENQGWAATFTNEQTGQMTGSPAAGGMTATYQHRENQPVAEDYLEERRSTSA